MKQKMLPKKFRLPKKEIEKVFMEGRAIPGSFLILKWKKSLALNSLFAIVVPISFSKKSSKRNKFKRKIRAALCKILPKIKDGFEFVLLAKNFPEIPSSSSLEKEINFLFKKGGFLKK